MGSLRFTPAPPLLPSPGPRAPPQAGGVPPPGRPGARGSSPSRRLPSRLPRSALGRAARRAPPSSSCQHEPPALPIGADPLHLARLQQPRRHLVAVVLGQLRRLGQLGALESPFLPLERRQHLLLALLPHRVMLGRSPRPLLLRDLVGPPHLLHRPELLGELPDVPRAEVQRRRLSRALSVCEGQRADCVRAQPVFSRRAPVAAEGGLLHRSSPSARPPECRAEHRLSNDLSDMFGRSGLAGRSVRRCSPACSRRRSAKNRTAHSGARPAAPSRAR